MIIDKLTFFFISLFYVQNYRIASVDGHSHYMRTRKKKWKRKNEYNDQLDGHCYITGKLEFWRDTDTKENLELKWNKHVTAIICDYLV